MHYVIFQIGNTGWLQGQQKQACTWKVSWNLFLLLDFATAYVCSFIFIWHFEHYEKESKELL